MKFLSSVRVLAAVTLCAALFASGCGGGGGGSSAGTGSGGGGFSPETPEVVVPAQVSEEKREAVAKVAPKLTTPAGAELPTAPEPPGVSHDRRILDTNPFTDESARSRSRSRGDNGDNPGPSSRSASDPAAIPIPGAAGRNAGRSGSQRKVYEFASPADAPLMTIAVWINPDAFLPGNTEPFIRIQIFITPENLALAEALAQLETPPTQEEVVLEEVPEAPPPLTMVTVTVTRLHPDSPKVVAGDSSGRETITASVGDPVSVGASERTVTLEVAETLLERVTVVPTTATASEVRRVVVESEDAESLSPLSEVVAVATVTTQSPPGIEVQVERVETTYEYPSDFLAGPLCPAGTMPRGSRTQAHLNAALLGGAGEGDTERVCEALRRGAEVDGWNPAGVFTPLLLAAFHSRAGAAEMLLANGADPNLANAAVDYSPLHYAARSAAWATRPDDARGTAGALLDAGADLEAGADASSGQTPLLYMFSSAGFSGYNGFRSAAGFFVKRGADVSAADDGGRTAFHYLARRSFRAREWGDLVKLLAGAGLDVNARDDAGRSARDDAAGGSGSAEDADYAWVLDDYAGVCFVETGRLCERAPAAVAVTLTATAADPASPLVVAGDVFGETTTTVSISAPVEVGRASGRVITVEVTEYLLRRVTVVPATAVATTRVVTVESEVAEELESLSELIAIATVTTQSPPGIEVRVERVETRYEYPGDFLAGPLCPGGTMPGKGMTQGELDGGLLSAARGNDLSGVCEYLRRGADVEAQEDPVSHFKRTALMIAATDGSLELAKMLHANGADINRQGGNGGRQDGGWRPWHVSGLTERGMVAAIHYASEAGHREMVKWLLDNGADLEMRVANGARPIHYAAPWGRAEVVKLLLSRGADVNAGSIWDSTALHHAVFVGSHEPRHGGAWWRDPMGLAHAKSYPEPTDAQVSVMIDILAKAGAKINARSGNDAALDYAARHEHAGFAAQLRGLGGVCFVETGSLCGPQTAAACSAAGLVLSGEVCASACPEGTVDVGGECSAAVTATTVCASGSLSANGMTQGELDAAMLSEARDNDLAGVCEYLRRGANVEAQEDPVSHFKRTALMIAATDGSLELAKMLHANGADVNRRGGNYSKRDHTWTRQPGRNPLNEDGENIWALIYAANMGHRDMAAWLLDRGARMSFPRDPVPHSALYDAAFMAHGDVVELFLERGADVSFRDALGRTPLFGALERATYRESRGVSSWRYPSGLNPDYPEPSRADVEEVIGMLVEAGGDVNERSGSDGLGWGTLDLAAEYNRRRYATLLRGYGAVCFAHSGALCGPQTAAACSAEGLVLAGEVCASACPDGEINVGGECSAAVTATTVCASGDLPANGMTQAELDAGMLSEARDNDLSGVCEYLRRGADVEAQEDPVSHYKRTALMIAAVDGSLELAKMLHTNGADLDRRGGNGERQGGSWRPWHVVGLIGRDMIAALHYASAAGHREMVKWLLDSGANLGIRMANGGQAIHAAVAPSARPEVAALLLERGADVNAKNVWGVTPLWGVAHDASHEPRHGRAWWRDPRSLASAYPESSDAQVSVMINMLAEAGVNVNARAVSSWQGRSPLDVAAHFGNPVVAAQLRGLGGVCFYETGSLCGPQTAAACSAAGLVLAGSVCASACPAGKVDVGGECSAAVTATTVCASGTLSDNGMTQGELDAAMLSEARDNDLAGVCEYLRRGANVAAQEDPATHFKRTALMIAATDGSLELAKMLHTNGANVNQRGGNYAKRDHTWTRSRPGRTSHNDNGENYWALVYAANKGHRDMVAWLLDRGSRISFLGMDPVPYSALSDAAFMAHGDVVELLLERGADVSFRDVFGRTPLFSALEQATYRESRGVSAWRHPSGYHSDYTKPSYASVAEVIGMLVEAGGDVNARSGSDGSGWATLDLAAEYNRRRYATLLRGYGAVCFAHSGALCGPQTAAACSAEGLVLAGNVCASACPDGEINVGGECFAPSVASCSAAGLVLATRWVCTYGCIPELPGRGGLNVTKSVCVSECGAGEVNVGGECVSGAMVLFWGGGGGTVSAESGGAALAAGDVAARGATVVFTATPEAGRYVSAWHGDCADGGEVGTDAIDGGAKVCRKIAAPGSRTLSVWAEFGESPSLAGPECPSGTLPAGGLTGDELFARLRTAAGEGDAAKICEWLMRGADVNGTRDGLELTALHEATRQGRLAAVLLLLANGADPNAQKETGGVGPLDVAAFSESDREDEATALRSAGAVCFRATGALCGPQTVASCSAEGLVLNGAVCAGECPEGKTNSNGSCVLSTAASRCGESDEVLSPSEGVCIEVCPAGYVSGGETGSCVVAVSVVVSVAVTSTVVTETTVCEGGTLPAGGMTQAELDAGLISAVEANDLAGACKYLRQGANVEALESGPSWRSRRTALIIAATDGNLEMAKLLRANGADVNRRSAVNSFYAPGLSPLHYAAKAGHRDMAKWLLDQGADIEGEALYGAADWGREEVVKLLLARGADPNVRAGTYRHSPLLRTVMEATRKGTRSFYGFSIPARDSFLAVVKLLADAGADVNARAGGGVYFGSFDTGLDFSALDVAAYRKDAEVAALLHDYGGACFARTEPLCGASVARCSAAGLVLSGEVCAAECPVGKTNVGGGCVSSATATTICESGTLPANGASQASLGAALIRAVDGYDLEGVCEFLRRGADINGLSDGSGPHIHGTDSTPLNRAIAANNLIAVKLLVANGADIEARSKYPWTGGFFTPLMHATYPAGRTEIAEFLIASGANVHAGHAINPWRPGGWTPLHRANLRVAKMLVANGADVNALNEDNVAPLHAALYSRHGDHLAVAEFLLANGANVNQKTNGGNSPLDSAARKRPNGDEAYAALLRKHGGVCYADSGPLCGGDFGKAASATVTVTVTAADESSPLVVAGDLAGEETITAAVSAPTVIGRAGGILTVEVTAYHLRRVTVLPLTTTTTGMTVTEIEKAGEPTTAVIAVATVTSQSPPGIEIQVAEVVTRYERPAGFLSGPLCPSGTMPRGDYTQEHLNRGLAAAAMRNDVEKICEHLRRGAQPDAPIPTPGWSVHKQSALMFAVSRDHLESARLLLDNGADVNLRFNAMHHTTDTALHKAAGGFTNDPEARKKQVEMIKFLLARGADPNTEASQRTPPLLSAMKSRNWHVIEALLDGGANVNTYDSWGWTPLHMAVEKAQSVEDVRTVLNLLLDRGADPNLANHGWPCAGWTNGGCFSSTRGDGPNSRIGHPGTPLDTAIRKIRRSGDVGSVAAEILRARGGICRSSTHSICDSQPVVAASASPRDEGDTLAEELRGRFAEAFDAGPAFGDAFGAVGFSQPSFLGRLDSLMRESGGSGTESFSGWEYENEVGKVWASASERGDFGFGASDGDDALSGSLGGSPFAALAGSGMMAGGEVGFGNDVKGRVAVFGDYRTESFLQGDEKQWADWAVRGVNGDAIETAMDAAEKFSALADGRARTRGAMTELHFGGSDVGVAFQAGAIEESESVLAGTSRGEALRGLRSRTAFAGVSGSVPVLGSGWRLRGAAHAGWSRAFSEGVLRTGSLWASAYSAGLERGGWLYSDDAFVLRFSQPLRVEDWEMELGDGSGAVRVLGAGPSGRQLDAEAAYRMPLSGGGWFLLSAGVRREGGHVRGNGTEGGAVFLVEREF